LPLRVVAGEESHVMTDYRGAKALAQNPRPLSRAIRVVPPIGRGQDPVVGLMPTATYAGR
jgi:hypothetical protein